jgi:hypothetical protein
MAYVAPSLELVGALMTHNGLIFTTQTLIYANVPFAAFKFLEHSSQVELQVSGTMVGCTIRLMEKPIQAT